ncbi:MAG: hypothetical protein BroJett013_11920 [Alphaproteobacteria bacterium]|nr:MAG: hypothetical protein BroJett013_11920 [Alphaproteobacteria bacterium]
MKPRKPPRRCAICDTPYHKTGSAKTCSPECSAEWLKIKHAKWRANNKEKWADWFARWRAENADYHRSIVREIMRNRREHEKCRAAD